MKRESTSFSIELGKLYTYRQVIHIVFYNYEIDLNTSLQDTDRWESIFSTELIKLLQWKKSTNMMVIQLLQNGLGVHYYNSGRQLQYVF